MVGDREAHPRTHGAAVCTAVASQGGRAHMPTAARGAMLIAAGPSRLSWRQHGQRSRLAAAPGGPSTLDSRPVKHPRTPPQVNPNIRRDKWSDEEDTQLMDLVKTFGIGKWAEIARHMVGRTDQQCMGRWRRHLDPSIRRVSSVGALLGRARLGGLRML
jgi:hypothetical protein